jgi:hypothetical protein
VGGVADPHGGGVQAADERVELVDRCAGPSHTDRLVQTDHDRQVPRGQAPVQGGRVSEVRVPSDATKVPPQCRYGGAAMMLKRMLNPVLEPALEPWLHGFQARARDRQKLSFGGKCSIEVEG